MRSIAFSTPNEINRHRLNHRQRRRVMSGRVGGRARGFLPHSVRVCSSLYSQVQSLHRIYELLSASSLYSQCIPAVGSLVHSRVSSNSRTKFPAEHFQRFPRNFTRPTFRDIFLRARTCILISFLPLFICISYYISLFVYKFALRVSLVAFARTIPTRIYRFRSFIRRTDFHVVPRAL